jgi:hypothetical protein
MRISRDGDEADADADAGTRDLEKPGLPIQRRGRDE